MITNQIRTATVIALQDVQLSYLEENHYRYLFKEQIERGLFLVDTLKSSFENIKRSNAAELSYYFDHKEVFYKNIIYKEGEEADSIYLIKSGSIELRQQGPDKREQSLSILTAGQFFGQEQGISAGVKRVCTAHCISNDTIIYFIRVKNLQLPQFEALEQAFQNQAQTAISWLNKRKKQLLHNAQENIFQLQEVNRKQQVQSKERKKSVEFIPLMLSPPAQTTTTTTRITSTRTARTARAASNRACKSRERHNSQQNSKQWNTFFDAMHSMHEEKRQLRFQSQPQLRYQNIQIIVESNMQYKRLQKQLLQQAPTVNLEKTNLSQIAKDMKTKGISLNQMPKNEQLNNNNRHNKSLEQIIKTIASRDSAPLNPAQIALTKNNNTSMNNYKNNTSFSPDNRKQDFHSILQQIQYLQSNHQQQNNKDSFIQQEYFGQPQINKNGSQSLIEINSMNQSLILPQQTCTKISQPILPNYSIQNINFDQSNSSPAPRNMKQIQSERRLAQGNSNIRAETETGKKKQVNTAIQSSQEKQQMIQIQNKGSGQQYPLRFLRMKQPNGNNTSLSVTSVGSSKQITYLGEDETIQDGTNRVVKLYKAKENRHQSSTTTSFNITECQSQLVTQRSQNKLNLHKKCQSISKPYQALQSEAAAQIQSKINSQQTNQSDINTKDSSVRLIKMMKVNDTSTPDQINQHDINANSPAVYDLQSQRQSTHQTDYLQTNQTLFLLSNSPSSVIARQIYNKIQSGGSDQNLTSEESPPSLHQRLAQQRFYRQIESFNQDSILENSENKDHHHHQQKEDINKNGQSKQINSQFLIQHNQSEQEIKKQNNDSFSPNSNRNNNHKMQEQPQTQTDLQNTQTEQGQQKTEGEVHIFQNRIEQMNNFSEAVTHTVSPLRQVLTLPQKQIQQNQSHTTPSRIQDVSNSFYLNQQSLNSKYLIYGNTLNQVGTFPTTTTATTNSLYHNHHSQQCLLIQQTNSTQNRFKYLDVKAETERIQQSLKQKKGQGQKCQKRKDYLERVMISSRNNYQASPRQQTNQNSMIMIQSVQDTETINMDKNVITKLQSLFLKQKPSTANSPSRSPIRIRNQSIITQSLTLREGQSLISKNDTAKYQNTSVREQTEGEETTPMIRGINTMPMKSHSFSNKFTNRKSVCQFPNQEMRVGIQEKANTLTDITDLKQRSLTRVLNRNLIGEKSINLQQTQKGQAFACQNHHKHIQLLNQKNQSNSQIESFQNTMHGNQESASTLQNIPIDIEINTSQLFHQSNKTQSQLQSSKNTINIQSDSNQLIKHRNSHSQSSNQDLNMHKQNINSFKTYQQSPQFKNLNTIKNHTNN